MNKFPNEKAQELIELPLKALGSNKTHNYSPQHNLFDGYTQMPRQVAPPYQNAMSGAYGSPDINVKKFAK